MICAPNIFYVIITVNFRNNNRSIVYYVIRGKIVECDDSESECLRNELKAKAATQELYFSTVLISSKVHTSTVSQKSAKLPLRC